MEYSAAKLKRGVSLANQLLDELILPGALQDELYVWALISDGTLREKEGTGRTDEGIKESDIA